MIPVTDLPQSRLELVPAYQLNSLLTKFLSESLSPVSTPPHSVNQQQRPPENLFTSTVAELVTVNLTRERPPWHGLHESGPMGKNRRLRTLNGRKRRVDLSHVKSATITRRRRRPHIDVTISLLSNHAKIDIPTVSKSERRCFICKSVTGRKRVPDSANLQVLQRHYIFIPPKNRTCASHLENNQFTNEALIQITADKQSFELSGPDITKWIAQLLKHIDNKVTILDFGKNSHIKPEDYHLLLGVTRDQFLELLEICRHHIHSSSNRSVENALALFLMKMRLDLPQKVLALLFGIDGQQRVSETITRVAEVLDREFVPYNLGCGEMHLNREMAESHDSEFYHRILDTPPKSLHVTCDATYLNIQKPSNFEVQRKTFSLHKFRNLVKPMLIVFADGYILDADGPWFSDFKNNDANILEKIVNRAGAGTLLILLQPGDVFILDRGFRDFVEKLRALGFKVVNGQIKLRFRFFDSIIQATYLPKIAMFFRIACAIHNKYGTRFRKSPENEDYIINEVIGDMDRANTLEMLIKDNGLLRKQIIWTAPTEADLANFPILSIDDLKKITLGTFQIRMADSYTNQHLQEEGEYRLFIHKENSSLFRVKLQSRFNRRATHQVWIQVDIGEHGHKAIDSYYCTCKTGSRTLGCCSHVCSVLKYCGYDRHQPPSTRRNHRAYSFLDAAVDIAGDEDDDE
ncbi:hypothetical protein Fcan01_13830 [Folsomia candida]|uniref:SWIM-type domain-containing protein n=1 Tax=Folsomia candida TaxID=158441 RepID=A0A226E346_FOLCA|nr:hypothetical protein Fcan01_13830 [Folsomia candida]